MDGYLEIYNSLSEEERMDARNKIPYRQCTNCTNPDCRIEFDEKIGLDENGEPQGRYCFAWVNKEMIVQEKIKILRKTR